MGVYLNGGFFMNTEFNKIQVIKYLAFTFGIAYAIQIIAWLLYSNGQQIIGQLVIAVMMFVPMLSVFLSGVKICLKLYHTAHEIASAFCLLYLSGNWMRIV